MLDHEWAHHVLHRFIAGEDVSDEELAQARDHMATCEDCRRQFELERTPACEAIEEDLLEAARSIWEGNDLASRHPAVAQHLEECARCTMILADLIHEAAPLLMAPRVPASEEREPARVRAVEPAVGAAMAAVSVEPQKLFEQALSAGLADPDPVRRQRAAQGLGALKHLGPAALASLAETAGQDPDEQVRAAALRALSRLASEGVVTELVGRTVPGKEGVTVEGGEGIRGQIEERRGQLRLSLKGLPPKFEHTKPLVAIPTALERKRPAVKWSGDQPGLVPVTEPVSGGSMSVTLGRTPKGKAPDKEKLFNRVYLLSPGAPPRKRRGGRA